MGLLALGTLLSSWIGTTGASMLMIRPIIKMNAWRKRKTPHRDLLYLYGVQHGRLPDSDRRSASAHGIHAGRPVLLELKAFTDPDLQYDHPAVHLLSFDMKAYRKDIAAGLKPDISKPGTEVKIRGSHNLIFIIMIVIAVILSGTLPSMPMFQDAAGNVLGIHVFGEVTLSYPAIIECVIILVSAFLSFKRRMDRSAERTTLPGARSTRSQFSSSVSLLRCSRRL